MTATQHLYLQLAIVLGNICMTVISFRKGDKRVGSHCLCLSTGFLLMAMDQLVPTTPRWISTTGVVFVMTGCGSYFVTGWLQRRRNNEPGNPIG